jgi:hypothetical protein
MDEDAKFTVSIGSWKMSSANLNRGMAISGVRSVPFSAC